ncbi:MAG: hypothetical protein IPM63_12560 [Acidobacteriota bacterium]|nr:MAG: hypothetical protein IPM63_12560 [Acidobacteriota bacterium]
MIAETSKRSVTQLSPEIRELGEQLLHHQCWFFGRDIWHPSGNLLIRFGFTRFGAPKGQDGGNSYRLVLDECSEIVIWGFGIFLGDESNGGVFIKRLGFNPKVLDTARLELPISKSEQLPKRRQPVSAMEQRRARALTLRITQWIACYEKWVDNTCGTGWRRRCLSDWESATMAQDDIALGWARLQGELEQF